MSEEKKSAEVAITVRRMKQEVNIEALQSSEEGKRWMKDWMQLINEHCEWVNESCIRELLKIGVCALCNIRMLNLNDDANAHHHYPVSTMDRVISLSKRLREIQGTGKVPCLVCSDAFIECFQQNSRVWNEKLKHFQSPHPLSISVRIPGTILIRDHWVRRRLAHQFGNEERGCVSGHAKCDLARQMFDIVRPHLEVIWAHPLRYQKKNEEKSESDDVSLLIDVFPLLPKKERRIELMRIEEERKKAGKKRRKGVKRAPMFRELYLVLHMRIFLKKKWPSSVRKNISSEGATFYSQTTAEEARDLFCAVPNDEIFFQWLCHCSVPTRIVSSEVKMIVHRRSQFILSRYRKLKRGMSQTPSKHTDSSVQCQLLCALRAFRLLGCESVKLIGGGREDSDVLMLGEGRPCLIELCNPWIDYDNMNNDDSSDMNSNSNKRSLNESKSSDDLLAEFEVFLSEHTSEYGIELIQSEMTDKESGMSIMHRAEQEKSKEYECVVWHNSEGVTSQSILDDRLSLVQFPLTLQQDTPVRVLIRRAPKIRERRILSIDEAERLSDHWIRLRLTTDAGTYVKEFIHSDRGRTLPFFAQLIGGDKSDLLRLDCIACHCEI